MPKSKQTLPTSDVPKFWNVITAEDADSAEITMYGDIVSRRPRDWWTGEEIDGQFITPEEFAEDLERIKGKSQITIKINSSGGEVYTAIAIHNALRALAGHKTVVVEGIAASAASVIMCAGDEVQVYPGSIVMIHGVRGWFDESMTLPEVRKAAKMMDATEKAMAAIYATKTGLAEEELRKLMFAETWMTGQQAIDQIGPEKTCPWLPFLIDVNNSAAGDEAHEHTIKDYTFRVHIYDRTYSNGIVDRYYWVTILHQGERVDPAERTPLSLFTRSEQHVASLLDKGLTYQEIADKLVISFHTVKKHVQNIYKKCGVKNRAQFSRWLNDSRGI